MVVTGVVLRSCREIQPRENSPQISVVSNDRVPRMLVLDPSNVAFIARMGSSSQQPVYYADFAEFVSEKQFSQLGQTNRALLEVVLPMQQEHVENRARRDKEIRLVMEHKAKVRRRENAERERQDRVFPQVSAIREAERSRVHGRHSKSAGDPFDCAEGFQRV